MKKFEYRMVLTESSLFKSLDYKEFSEQLNQLGSQGWELVSTVSLTNSTGQTTSLLTTLKRELPG